MHQDQLASLSVKASSGEALPLLQAALHTAVAGTSHAEQAAASRLLEAYCCGNAAGQAVLSSSVLQSAAAAPSSFGGFLLHSLGRQGALSELAASSRAAGVLAHLVSGNPGIRPHLLALQVQQQQQHQQSGRAGAAAAAAGAAATSTSGSSSLMSLCAGHLGQLVSGQHGRLPSSAVAAADTLHLLLLWLQACPPAVTAFLRAVSQSQPFLVDSIRGSNACSGSSSSGHPLTRGMLALLLGLCASHAEDGAGTPNQQQLLAAIEQQIGKQQFVGILDALLNHLAVAEASSASSSAAIFTDSPAASPGCAAFLRTLAVGVLQRITGSAVPPALISPLAQQAVSSGMHPPDESFSADAAAQPAPTPAPLSAPATFSTPQPTPHSLSTGSASWQSNPAAAEAQTGAHAAGSNGDSAVEMQQALALIESLQR